MLCHRESCWSNLLFIGSSSLCQLVKGMSNSNLAAACWLEASNIQPLRSVIWIEESNGCYRQLILCPSGGANVFWKWRASAILLQDAAEKGCCGGDVPQYENEKVFLANFLALLNVKCRCVIFQVIWHVETTLPNLNSDFKVFCRNVVSVSCALLSVPRLTSRHMQRDNYFMLIFCFPVVIFFSLWLTCCSQMVKGVTETDSPLYAACGSSVIQW